MKAYTNHYATVTTDGEERKQEGGTMGVPTLGFPILMYLITSVNNVPSLRPA